MNDAEKLTPRQKHAQEIAAARARATATLAAAIRADGGTCTDDLTEVDDVRIVCRINEQISRAGWRSGGNGRLYASLGDYGDRVTMPEPKAGYGAKQAKRIRQYARDLRAKNERNASQQAVRDANRKASARLCAAIGQKTVYETHGHALSVSQTDTNTAAPCLLVQGNEATLLQAIAALRALGITY